MSTILDDAEQRIAPAAATAHTRQQEIIEAMREENGRQHYEQAQGQLVELERVIAHTYRPFLNRVGTIAAKAKAPPARAGPRLAHRAGDRLRSVPTAGAARPRRLYDIAGSPVEGRQNRG